MRIDGCKRRLVGGVDGEGGIIHATERCRPLDGLFDARLGTEIHSLRAFFAYVPGCIDDTTHGKAFLAVAYYVRQLCILSQEKQHVTFDRVFR